MVFVLALAIGAREASVVAPPARRSRQRHDRRPPPRQPASLRRLPTRLTSSARPQSARWRRDGASEALLRNDAAAHRHAAVRAAAGGHADAAGLEPIFSRESRAFLRQCCPPNTTEASAPSTPPPAPRPATATASGSRPELPEKYHVLTELPIFTGVDVDPNEWDDIFKWTGHVWQKKEFPTRKGGAKREEARRLLRVLELMDSGGDGEAPTAEAAAGAAVVHEAVLAETASTSASVRRPRADRARVRRSAAMVKGSPHARRAGEAKARDGARRRAQLPLGARAAAAGGGGARRAE